MGVRELLRDPDFLGMDEDTQLQRLQEAHDDWKLAVKHNPVLARQRLRALTGRPEGEGVSTLGDVANQFAEGAASMLAATVKAPIDLYEMAGGETDIDDAIERFQQRHFSSAPQTRAGEIARAAGAGAAAGLAVAGGGQALAATKLPYVARAANWLAEGYSVETVSGAVGSAVDEASRDWTDSWWLQLGAGLLAGGVTATAMVKRRRRKLAQQLGQPAGEVQSAAAGAAVPPSSAQVSSPSSQTSTGGPLPAGGGLPNATSRGVGYDDSLGTGTQAAASGSQRSMESAVPPAATSEPTKRYASPSTQVTSESLLPLVGTKHPQTGKRIMHAIPDDADPEQVMKFVGEVKPAMDDYIRRLVGGVDGAAFDPINGVGVRYTTSRVKEGPSLRKKLNEKPPNQIGDLYGGRVLIDRLEAIEELRPKLMASTVKGEWEDFTQRAWPGGELRGLTAVTGPDRSGYRAVHAQILDPSTGFSGEVQVIPREIAKAMNEGWAGGRPLHDLYDELKDIDTAWKAGRPLTEAEKALLRKNPGEMRDGYTQAWEAFLRRSAPDSPMAQQILSTLDAGKRDYPWIPADSASRIAEADAIERARSVVQQGEELKRARTDGAGQAARAAIEEPNAAELRDMMRHDPIDPGIMERAWSEDTERILAEGVKNAVPVMEPEMARKFYRAGVNIMERAGIARDPTKSLMNQVIEIAEAGRLDIAEIDSILRDHGSLSLSQMLDAWVRSVSTYGKGLAQGAAEARRLTKVLGRDLTEREREVLASVGGPDREGLGWWRRFHNASRGAATGAVATAMRNIIAQTAGVSVKAMEEMMESTLQRMTGRKAAQHPLAALGTMSRIANTLNPLTPNRSKLQTELIEDALGKETLDPLFTRYSSDIDAAMGPGNGLVGALEKWAHWANALNRTQEWALRRSAFTAALDNLLDRKGLSLAKMEAAGTLDQLDMDDVKTAINYALDVSWGQTFHPSQGGARGIAGLAIDLVNRATVGPFALTQILPFPRFMATSMGYLFEHMPHRFFRSIYSPAARAKIAAGDFSELSKAATGTAALLGAYQIRNSEYAGERWYELRPPDQVAEALGFEPGTTIDMRPVNPFASFFFISEIVRRMRAGEPPMDLRDMAMGVLSTNLRAGAGLYVLDNFVQSVQEMSLPGTGEEALDDIMAGLATYGGEVMARFAQPLSTVTDLVASFDESQAVLRDRSANPLLGPTLTKIPYAAEAAGLPEVQVPTRAATPKSSGTALRQFTGITTRDPKNPAERELDRLSFGRSQILPSSGVDDYDTLREKYMGPLVEQGISPLVQSRVYQQLDDPTRAVVIERALKRVRQIANAAAMRERPDLYYETREGRRSQRMQRWIASRYGTTKSRADRIFRREQS